MPLKRYKELSEEKAHISEQLMFTPECRLIDVTDHKKNYESYQDVTPENVFSGKSCFLHFGVLNLPMIDAQEAISRLRYEKPNLQICFRSQQAIDDCLAFKEAKVL